MVGIVRKDAPGLSSIIRGVKCEMRFTPEQVDDLNARFVDSHPVEIISWAIEQFQYRVSLACSLGAEDMVILDILSKNAPEPRVFVLDTGRLHQETYDTLEAARLKYGVDFDVYFPLTESLEMLVAANGPNSFYTSVENRRECCRIRKVEPLQRALSGLDAWITGLRRGQTQTRITVARFEIDNAHGGLLKINPLADWSEDDVWDYIRDAGVPYNTLHDSGYPSIGCAPCTRRIDSGEDLRAGRWWWESPEQKECGIHIVDGKVVRR